MQCQRIIAGQHASVSGATEKAVRPALINRRPARLVTRATASCSTGAEEVSLGHSIARRSALQAAILSVAYLVHPHLPHADARGFDQYIKKKQLDPLITYVPLVLEARLQLQSAGNVMESDTSLAKSLLREGAFSGLRDNIRAIGEYAQKAGAEDATERVTGFFKALEAFDLVLSTSIRTGADLDLDAARTALQGAEEALNGVIALVPGDVLQQGQEVLDIVLEKSRAASLDTAAAAPIEDLAPLLP